MPLSLIRDLIPTAIIHFFVSFHRLGIHQHAGLRRFVEIDVAIEESVHSRFFFCLRSSGGWGRLWFGQVLGGLPILLQGLQSLG